MRYKTVRQLVLLCTTFVLRYNWAEETRLDELFEERSCYSQRKIYVCYNRLSHINGKLQLSYLLATYCIGSCQSIFHNSRPHFLFHITRRRARLVANNIRSSIGCLYFTCLFRHLIFFLLLIAIIYHFSLSIAFPSNFSSSIFVNLGIIVHSSLYSIYN